MPDGHCRLRHGCPVPARPLPGPQLVVGPPHGRPVHAAAAGGTAPVRPRMPVAAPPRGLEVWSWPPVGPWARGPCAPVGQSLARPKRARRPVARSSVATAAAPAVTVS